MSEPPTVLVLGGGTRLPRALHRAGVRVIFAGTPDEFTGGHQAVCAEAWLADTVDEDFWVRRATALHQDSPFSRVVSLRERFLSCAARINHALGLGPNSLETVLMLKDKAVMRQVLAANGAGVLARLLETPEDLRFFVQEAGFPVIVKPRDGTGSEGVVVLRGPQDLPGVRARIEDRPGTLLAEEFLNGPEFSVETLSFEGVHQVLEVTEKFVGENLVEAGHLVPARVSAADRDALVEATREFLGRVGLVDGPAHTELILTPAGPRVVESHNRYGGDGINDLVRSVIGADPRDLFARQIAKREPAVVGTGSGAAAVWFVTARPGRVTALEGWDRAAAAPGVTACETMVAVGDLVVPLSGSDDRCGWVMATGATGDEVLSRVRHAVSLIGIRTEPEEAPGLPAC
ncbi:ATP-grasp domain-containing protein [Kineosporia sp. J2-2]|uniref:ATP-grasp domain-containing protein n=1 Tax=Kineosporia corallincola TaxID=2835133 RepID=A0ABS5TS31_9ACTN|nr:ATP-grasp domain-containing protein [Kineosporia corallincola]MBT0773589.1 ATP-grasp domain-containing protein [Kineosporia corallincola]